jgi:hypothetical protein
MAIIGTTDDVLMVLLMLLTIGLASAPRRGDPPGTHLVATHPAGPPVTWAADAAS